MDERDPAASLDSAIEASVVFVVEDDADVRSALEDLFRSTGLAVEAFSSGAELLALVLPDVASCLVVDVRLPQISGFELQAELLARGVEIPIVFMTGFGDVPMSVRAMKAGAVDFLSKPFRDQEMLDAVSGALIKDRARRAAVSHQRPLHRSYATLTRREREVFGLVMEGLLNKQIAGRLGISEITVKLHRGKLMRKMGARTLAHLVRIGSELDVVAPVPPSIGSPRGP